MKCYADLFIESPKAFLRKLEEDIKAIEAHLNRLDSLAASSVGHLLEEYERLALVVESKAYGVRVLDSWSWAAGGSAAPAGNLYSPEQVDGRWFCWTGPAPETQFVAAVRREIPLTLRVSCDSAPGLDALDKMQIVVDGKRVETTRTEDGVEAQIPVRERLSALPTVLVLDTRDTIEPGNGDERKLGLALFSLSLEPAGSKEQHRG